jgi:hypothetical protein
MIGEDIITYAEFFLNKVQCDNTDTCKIQLFEKIIDMNKIIRNVNNYTFIRDRIKKDIEALSIKSSYHTVIDISNRLSELGNTTIKIMDEINDEIQHSSVKLLLELDISFPIEKSSNIWYNNILYEVYEIHNNLNTQMKYIILGNNKIFNNVNILLKKINTDELDEISDEVCNWMAILSEREHNFWNKLKNIFKRKEG